MVAHCSAGQTPQVLKNSLKEVMVPVLALRRWRSQLTQTCALSQGDRGESGPSGPYGPKGEGFPGPSVRHWDLGPSVCPSVCLSSRW